MVLHEHVRATMREEGQAPPGLPEGVAQAARGGRRRGADRRRQRRPRSPPPRQACIAPAGAASRHERRPRGRERRCPRAPWRRPPAAWRRPCRPSIPGTRGRPPSGGGPAPRCTPGCSPDVPRRELRPRGGPPPRRGPLRVRCSIPRVPGEAPLRERAVRRGAALLCRGIAARRFPVAAAREPVEAEEGEGTQEGQQQHGCAGSRPIIILPKKLKRFTRTRESSPAASGAKS